MSTTNNWWPRSHTLLCWFFSAKELTLAKMRRIVSSTKTRDVIVCTVAWRSGTEPAVTSRVSPEAAREMVSFGLQNKGHTLTQGY